MRLPASFGRVVYPTYVSDEPCPVGAPFTAVETVDGQVSGISLLLTRASGARNSDRSHDR